ncbi:hypothetical protein L6164_008003 [Bauhinia variegata]|uniref:Uncharacterized protein n=1 Tax=Bauhinia variegata TaxID=167791 RepID=A0ACB9PF97_BAUVA|nr:hypothetical protein L6164_008003 [Bauhinia variegata]
MEECKFYAFNDSNSMTAMPCLGFWGKRKGDRSETGPPKTPKSIELPEDFEVDHLSQDRDSEVNLPKETDCPSA